MNRKKPLDAKVVQNIKDLLRKGISSRKIAQELKVSQSSVMNIRKEGGLNHIKAKNDCPNILTEREAIGIGRILATGKARTPKEAAKMNNIEGSIGTVQRALKKVCSFAAKKPKKPKWTKKQKMDGLKFAKEHQHWTVDDWKRILWSDECIINWFNLVSVRYFGSKVGVASQDHKIIETVKHGGSSIMVWGCFSYFGVSPLVEIKEIMNKEVYLKLIYNALPVAMRQMEFLKESIIFQQDNDPKHTWFKTG